MTDTAQSFVVGDIHGQFGKLLSLLRRHGIVDGNYDWAGGRTQICFVGDYVNRGDSGLDVPNLIRHLQAPAADEGGNVVALLGNHDVGQLAARHFALDPNLGADYLHLWLELGGHAEDIQSMNGDVTAWLSGLPAIDIIRGNLIMHADSDFYLAYGGTVEEINTRIRDVLTSDDAEDWKILLDRFADRHVFDDTDAGGRSRARLMLRTLGASRLIHGHTPIDKVTNARPETITRPFIYAGGLCVNVDGGMYRGGPGFMWRLEESL
jgi:hypothetical protein